MKKMIPLFSFLVLGYIASFAISGDEEDKTPIYAKFLHCTNVLEDETRGNGIYEIEVFYDAFTRYEDADSKKGLMVWLQGGPTTDDNELTEDKLIQHVSIQGFDSEEFTISADPVFPAASVLELPYLDKGEEGVAALTYTKRNKLVGSFNCYRLSK